MAKIKSWPAFLLFDILLHLKIHDITKVKGVAKFWLIHQKPSYVSLYFNV